MTRKYQLRKYNNRYEKEKRTDKEKKKPVECKRKKFNIDVT